MPPAPEWRTRFVIYSLPRCGSTAMANMLNCHPDIRCLIEPFVPHRYDGQFHQLATKFSVDFAMEVIWDRWNGVKHVWLPDGTPFKGKPEWNEKIALGPRRKVIVMLRRNLLRRAVSNVICAQTGFWIGTREEFMQRLAATPLLPLDPESLRERIRRERDAAAAVLALLKTAGASFRVVYYEDLFPENGGHTGQFGFVNNLLEFLEFRPVTEREFSEAWQPLFDPQENRWASPEVYEMLPGARQIDDTVGCEETGWLFR